MQSVTTSGQRDKTSPKSKSEINPQKKKCASGKIATCPQRTVMHPQKMRTTKSTPIWRMFYGNYIIKAACAMKSYLFLHCIFILLAVTNQLIELKSFIPFPHPSLFQISTYLALQGNLISKTFANFQNINSKKHKFPTEHNNFPKKATKQIYNKPRGRQTLRGQNQSNLQTQHMMLSLLSCLFLQGQSLLMAAWTTAVEEMKVGG